MASTLRKINSLGCPFYSFIHSDSEPLQSGKGRALNVKVAQTCLALHVSHQFTHFAATDGGKDHEDKLEEDGKYVPNPRVAYGVFEGPTRFGRRVPGDALRAGEGTQRNRTLWRRGDTDSLWSRHVGR